MTRTYNVIDADGHVLEPPDMWLNYLESKYHDRAPRIVLNKHGKETLQIEPGRIWFEVDASWPGCDRDLLTAMPGFGRRGPSAPA